MITVFPAKVTEPEPKFNEPVAKKLKLFIVIAGAGLNVKPAAAASIVAPLAIVKVPAEAPKPPNAAACPIVNFPELNVKPPVYVFC